MPLENYIWYEKYRPHTLEDMVLKPDYRKTFSQYIKDQNIPHLLFYGPPGCISSDTHIQYVVCSRNGKIQNHKGGTIERLYHRFNHLPFPGQGSYQRPETIDSKFFVQSIDDNGRVFLNLIENVVYSGFKEVFRLETLSGKWLELTESHEIWVGDGYKKLMDLGVGDSVYVNPGKPGSSGGRKTKPKGKEIYVKYHPNASTRIYNGITYYRLGIHHVAFEADVNGIPYDKYIIMLNTLPPEELNKLWVIPKGCEIHHRDEDVNNNKPHNLQLAMSSRGHQYLHIDKAKKNIAIYVKSDPIVSITQIGRKSVYDIQCKDPYHNFIAGGVAVHNSGKTTLGFILLEHIPCHKLVLNASSRDRGIETIKTTVHDFAASMPMRGKNKFVFLDECFHGDSSVSTPNGNTLIRDINPGDFIYNAEGISRVIKTHCNRVPLERVVKIKLSNENNIICSKEHRFFTSKGEIEAQYLNKDHLLFSPISNIMVPADLLNKHKENIYENTNENTQRLCMVQKEILYKESKARNLFQKLCGSFKQQKKRNSFSKETSPLSLVRKTYNYSGFPEGEKAFLFPVMCGYVEESPAGNKKEDVYSRKQEENFKGDKIISQNEPGAFGCNSSGIFIENENKFPFTKPNLCRESQNNEKSKRNSPCMECSPRREWPTSPYSTENSSVGFGMGDRICHFFRCAHRGIPDPPQNRHSKSYTKDRNRSRWGFPPWNRKNKGCQEGFQVSRVRVENIEVYQPDGDGKSFAGIISDKEKDKGFIEFYDLTVEGHSSYFVEGVMVHNCDQMTRDAQMALRNTMETFSKTCKFILTANYIDKINEALLSRTTNYEFNTYPKRRVLEKLNQILADEKVEANPDDVWLLVERFYPDMRTIINSMQSASIDGKFNLRSIASLKVDPQELSVLLWDGKLKSLRKLWLGTTDFTWIYKILFNDFIYKVKQELRADAALAIADHMYKDTQVIDHEINMVSCCLNLMITLGVSPDFEG